MLVVLNKSPELPKFVIPASSYDEAGEETLTFVLSEFFGGALIKLLMKFILSTLA